MIRKIATRYAETRLDDELVLMNVDTGSFHTIKETALAIWDLLDETEDQAAICARLLEQYDVDEQTCAAQVGRFVDQMVEAGFVEHT